MLLIISPGPEAASITSSSPHDIWAVNNQDIELDCQTSGFPRPTVTWKRDNQEIKKCYEHEPCAGSQRYLVTYNGLKIVKPRYPDDDAVFRCEASNPFGKAHRDFVVVVPGELEQLLKTNWYIQTALLLTKLVIDNLRIIKGSNKHFFYLDDGRIIINVVLNYFQFRLQLHL